MKKYNFFAGPAILPQSVLREAGESVAEFSGMGLSLIEISHRSKEFAAVLEEAEALVRSLLDIKDDYAVLFLTGGASSQFYMVPMNVLNPDETAGYLDTGSWSTKAIKEAGIFGNVEVVASSKDENYSYIPKGFDIKEEYKYLHLTSNNTIYGTQIHAFPSAGNGLVCDMSSDIFSRKIDVSKFNVIYAGAQKNLGPAGVTLVIVKKDLLGRVDRTLPSMLDYRTHINKGSAFNTPPVFPIYVSMLNLRWIKDQGGLEVMERRNEEKASLLYAEIDRNSCFNGTARVEDRSKMNVCFLLKEGGDEAKFLELCAEAGCIGLKGHRSVGGFRASIYNAMEKEGVVALVEVMQKYESMYG